MFGQRIVIKRGSADETEKPFWISYSDMMTALMVLFLVVMAVALLSIPKKMLHANELRQKHQQQITHFMQNLKAAAKVFPGVEVSVDRRTINYGARAHFGFDSSSLEESQMAFIRGFSPVILQRANTGLGQELLKRVLVKGYTDVKGSYLYNLNLSLKRSESVICALLSSNGKNELTKEQKRQVLQLFVVAGYSFTDRKASAEESRRVEMQLEFYGFGEKPSRPSFDDALNIGECAA